MMNIEPLHGRHVEQAVRLVLRAYDEERAVVSCLPPVDERGDLFRRLYDCADNGLGVAAYDGGELVGFLAGMPVDTFFGTCSGVYVPLYAHGTIRGNRRGTYQLLYEVAAEHWTKQGLLQHAITVFPHTDETVETWFWLGFGLRCVDAIRVAEPLPVASRARYKIKKVETLDEARALAAIDAEHTLYYRRSPMFMPRAARSMSQAADDLCARVSREHSHIWAAYVGSDPVGIMYVEPTGESFVSEHPSVMNITTAYVVPVARTTGVGTHLLHEVQTWMRTHGYALCGVDFESFNRYGSRFWNRYFTPYTYSLVRRIDERILETQR
jgi:GNAT superfamily N-acetyltransferase